MHVNIFGLICITYNCPYNDGIKRYSDTFILLWKKKNLINQKTQSVSWLWSDIPKVMKSDASKLRVTPCPLDQGAVRMMMMFFTLGMFVIIIYMWSNTTEQFYLVMLSTFHDCRLHSTYHPFYEGILTFNVSLKQSVWSKKLLHTACYQAKKVLNSRPFICYQWKVVSRLIPVS